MHDQKKLNIIIKITEFTHSKGTPFKLFTLGAAHAFQPHCHHLGHLLTCSFIAQGLVGRCTGRFVNEWILSALHQNHVF